MVRRILGLTVLVVVTWLALKVVFGLVSTLAGVLVGVLALAAGGYLCYLVLRAFSPSTADKVRHLITGRATTVV
jgi:thiol:disulfide interchange protein